MARNINKPRFQIRTLRRSDCSRTARSCRAPTTTNSHPQPGLPEMGPKRLVLPTGGFTYIMTPRTGMTCPPLCVFRKASKLRRCPKGKLPLLLFGKRSGAPCHPLSLTKMSL